jgi:hypothetical protein
VRIRPVRRETSIPDSGDTLAAESHLLRGKQDQRDPKRIGDKKMSDLHPHWREEKNVDHPGSCLQHSQKYDRNGDPPCERRSIFAMGDCHGERYQQTSEQSSDNRMPDTQADKNVG